MKVSDEKITDRTADAPADKTDVELEVSNTAVRGQFTGELIGISLKAVAVALSVFMLILSILTVAMPLSAMRVFNKLGMKERALVSGGQYISTRIGKYKKDYTDENGKVHYADELGNYIVLSDNAELSDDDMQEALNVCVTLSGSLMTECADNGDKKNAEYFAQKLELYTRQYASLSGIGQINTERSKLAVANVPSISMRPFVYDYTHTNLVLNYRARVYTGETDYMLIDNVAGDNIRGVTDLAGSYGGLTSALNVGNIDRYVDYIGQLGAYLDIKLTELGVTGNLTESFAASNLKNVMDGTEFELFVDKINGYSSIYRMLKDGSASFTKYAQAAVDYAPTTTDERLHQLFWMQEFATVSTRLYYLGMILYYNHEAYGQKSNEVKEEYDDLHMMKYVNYDGMSRQLSEVYVSMLNEYIRIFS